MENCGSTDSSTSGDLSTICDSAADPPDPSSGNIEQTTSNDLPIYMNGSLNFQDSQNLARDLISSMVKDDTLSSLRENKSDDHYGTKIGNVSSNKCLDKCATFPCTTEIPAGVDNKEKKIGKTSADSAQNCHSESATRPCLRSASVPSTLKLVPAIKGSREKLGNPPRNLTVKWAPDVYDPVPTAVSHVPNNKSQRHRSDGKKNGRNKQKGGGKSSGSSSRSKDKKQARKVVRGSRSCYKALDDDFPEAPPASLPSMADFEVESADASCGSSFLKKSVAQMHFSVAEAT